MYVIKFINVPAQFQFDVSSNKENDPTKSTSLNGSDGDVLSVPAWPNCVMQDGKY